MQNYSETAPIPAVGLKEECRKLAQDHLSLLKVEAKESRKGLTTLAIVSAVAIGMVFQAGVILLAALSLLLEQGTELSMGWSFFIVSVVAIALALLAMTLCYLYVRKKLTRPFATSIKTFREDFEWIRMNLFPTH